MDHIKLIKEKLSVEKTYNIVKSSSRGDVYMYIGTRETFAEQNQVESDYEAPVFSEVHSLKTLCNEVRNTWPHIENIAVIYRTGPLSEGELRTIVAVSSQQRQESIKATEQIIEKLQKYISMQVIETPAAKIPSFHNFLSNKNIEIIQAVVAPYVPPDLVQIKATNKEIEERITKFMQRKRNEIDANNIREFCLVDPKSEYSCARVDAILQKRKDSKSHLQVHRVLNTYQHRDQKNSNYLTKFIPPNGVEERLKNVECQLGLTTPVPKNIFKRLKFIEDRLLQLESVSPEYIQHWDKVSLPIRSSKKRIICIDEVDDLITELEKQIKGS